MARHSKTAALDNTLPLGILTPEEVKRAAAQIDGKVTESWGFGKLKWNAMQIKVFKHQADELGLLGGKGSSKSTAARGWLVMGNPHLPQTDAQGQPILVNRSYTYHPNYRALILRKNQEDLDDFIQRAAEMWGPTLGGQYVDGHFRFPSGAIIDCGHMKDATAWQKYLGIEFQRIAIDEAALIPDFASYEQLRSCMRTVHSELKTQILLTSNAHGRGACVPYGEVLTPSGWKDIKSMSVGDQVYTVTEIGSLVETVVSQVHSSYYKGKMASVDMRGFHMACTPNHEVAYVPEHATHRVGPHKLRRMDKFPATGTVLRSVEWQGQHIESFEPPPFHRAIQDRLKQPQSLSGDLYAELMGWFLSEGWTLSRERDRLFGIAQLKEPQKSRIEALLNECGFSYRTIHNGFSICSPCWWSYLRQFGKCHEKYIPSALKNATKSQLQILFTALMDGDGCWGRKGKANKKIEDRPKTKDSGVYYTTSKRLADDVAEICLKLGYMVFVSGRDGRDGDVCGHAQRSERLYAYEVHFRMPSRKGTRIATGNKLNASQGRKDQPKLEWNDYSGRVYCIGIADTHTFVIRQNGAVWVSGNSWLRERFMDVCVGKKENGGRIWSSNPERTEGDKIPHGETIFEEFKDPDTGEMFAQSRVWIFSNYKDNPAVMRTGYGRQLATLTDPKMRRAYLEGDWDAFFGSYFSDVFRPRGPHAGEPDNANHVINPIKLTPWWNRTIAMDWGYAHETAVLWGAKAPDGRFYIYREMAASQVSPERWGYEIANASREELESLKSHSMTLYLSHDAFQNRNGDHTIAEIVALGIARVLGPKAVHLPDLMIRKIKEAYYQDMMGGDSALARDKAIEDVKLQKRLGITIRMAEKTSVIGWQHCRELMRFEQIGTINNEFDGNLAMKILQESGPDKFNEFVNLYRVAKQEVLPKLQIFSTLKRLIDAIPKAQHVDGEEDMDKAHFFGKDLCFVAGTMVSTEHGPKPIENIRKGEMVLTRSGYKPVVEARCTGESDIVTVLFSNGVRLTGTPNHPVWVRGKNFVRMDELCYADVVCERKSYSRDISTQGYPTQSEDTCESISGLIQRITENMGWALSIAKYGKTLMGQFQRASVFTTRTGTLSTIPSTIWSACPDQTMHGFMGWKMRGESGRESGLLRFDRLLRRGTDLPRESNGTKSTARQCGLIISSTIASVGSAIRSSLRLTNEHQCAPLIVGQKIEDVPALTTKNVFVRFAGKLSYAINTLLRKPADVRVVARWAQPRGIVYNLTVADSPEYFANDILVHNCDAFSYLVLGASDDTPQEPFEAYRDRMMGELLDREPGATTMGLVAANMEWESKFKSLNSVAPYTPPRKARMRGLIQRGQWKQPMANDAFGGRLQ